MERPSHPEKMEPTVGPKAKISPVLPNYIQGEKFFRGPVSLRWLTTAGRLPGRALQAALVCQHLGRLKKSRRFRLEGALLKEMGVSRQSVYRALDRLERAGLLQVKRKQGRCPIVTILDLPRSASICSLEVEMPAVNETLEDKPKAANKVRANKVRDDA
jgi:DNA-binding MarR family transcriptional regulator